MTVLEEPAIDSVKQLLAEADALLESGDVQDAHRLLDEALTIADRENIPAGKIHAHRAEAFERQCDFDSALQAQLVAVEEFRRVFDPANAQSAVDLAHALACAGRYRQGHQDLAFVDDYNEAIALAAPLSDVIQHANCAFAIVYDNWALWCSNHGQPVEAIAHYDALAASIRARIAQVDQAAELPTLDAQLAEALCKRAAIVGADDVERAIEAYENAIDLLTTGEAKATVFLACGDRLEEASECARAAACRLAAARVADDPDTVANARLLAIESMKHVGDADAALDLATRRLRRNTDPALRARLHAAAARLLMDDDRLDEAAERLGSALSELARHATDEATADVWEVAAAGAARAGDPDVELDAWYSASAAMRALLEESEDDARLLRFLNARLGIARIHAERGECPRAATALDEPLGRMWPRLPSRIPAAGCGDGTFLHRFVNRVLEAAAVRAEELSHCARNAEARGLIVSAIDLANELDDCDRAVRIRTRVLTGAGRVFEAEESWGEAAETYALAVSTGEAIRDRSENDRTAVMSAKLAWGRNLQLAGRCRQAAEVLGEALAGVDATKSVHACQPESDGSETLAGGGNSCAQEAEAPVEPQQADASREPADVTPGIEPANPQPGGEVISNGELSRSWRCYGEALEHLGRCAEAAAAFDRALTFIEKGERELEADLFINRAGSRSHVGEYERAHEDLTRAMDLAGDDRATRFAALRVRAQIFALEGDCQSSASAWQAAAEAARGSQDASVRRRAAEALTELSRERDHLDKGEEALAAADEAVSILASLEECEEEALATAHEFRAEALLTLDRANDALTAFQKAIDALGGDARDADARMRVASMYGQRARIHAFLGAEEEALRESTRQLAILKDLAASGNRAAREELPKALFRRGAWLSETGETAAGEASIESAVAAAREDGDVPLAQLFEEKAKWHQGQGAFEAMAATCVDAALVLERLLAAGDTGRLRELLAMTADVLRPLADTGHYAAAAHLIRLSIAYAAPDGRTEPEMFQRVLRAARELTDAQLRNLYLHLNGEGSALRLLIGR